MYLMPRHGVRPTLPARHAVILLRIGVLRGEDVFEADVVSRELFSEMRDSVLHKWAI